MAGVTHSVECLTEQANATHISVGGFACRVCILPCLQDAMKQSSVPGYRKGAKIPASILVGYLGGKNEVSRLAAERALRDSLPLALANVESEAITDSERIESNSEDLLKSFDVQKPFVYQIGVDLPARVEFTSPYKWVSQTAILAAVSATL